ncbi:MAG: hypothetical protein LBD20_00520 [Spirochaetaceae bacterium]|jgi:hypothetical protein|nr:hypothetical protein [Spirochaetaceae bacterium]
MTFPRHSILLKAGAACAFIVLIGTAVLTPKLIPVLKTLAPNAGRRAGLPLKTLLFTETVDTAPLIALFAVLIFACAAISCILYFFENTDSAEIHYIEIFACMCAVEALRLTVPLKALYQFSPFYLMSAQRFLVFARFSSFCALLAAGLFAAGIKLRKQESLLFPFGLASLIIAIRIPIDIYDFDTSLNPILGFASMYKAIEICTVILAAGSFLAGAVARSSKEYIPAGLGVILLALGKSALQTADNIILILPAALALFAGFYLFCSSLRKLYMWL